MELALDLAWTSPKSAGPQPAWILCRGLSQFPIPDDAILESWAERGRIRPDDYLINSKLDTCVQAKDVDGLLKPRSNFLLAIFSRK